jgi:hypothetical protein
MELKIDDQQQSELNFFPFGRTSTTWSPSRFQIRAIVIAGRLIIFLSLVSSSCYAWNTYWAAVNHIDQRNARELSEWDATHYPLSFARKPIVFSAVEFPRCSRRTITSEEAIEDISKRNQRIEWDDDRLSTSRKIWFGKFLGLKKTIALSAPEEWLRADGSFKCPCYDNSRSLGMSPMHALEGISWWLNTALQLRQSELNIFLDIGGSVTFLREQWRDWILIHLKEGTGWMCCLGVGLKNELIPALVDKVTDSICLHIHPCV